MTKIGEKSSSHYLPVFAGLLCLAALAAACDAPPGIAATSDAIRHDIDMAWQACQEVSGSPTASHLSGQVFGVGNSYYGNSPNGYYVGTDTHVIGFYDISKGWSNRLTSDGQASTLAAAQAVVCSREVYTHVRTCSLPNTSSLGQDHMCILAHVTLFTWPAKVLMAEGTLTAEADPCVPGSGSFSDLKLRDWLNWYTDSH